MATSSVGAEATPIGRAAPVSMALLNRMHGWQARQASVGTVLPNELESSSLSLYLAERGCTDQQSSNLCQRQVLKLPLAGRRTTSS
jgi:hypothetical protein